MKLFVAIMIIAVLSVVGVVLCISAIHEEDELYEQGKGDYNG